MWATTPGRRRSITGRFFKRGGTFHGVITIGFGSLLLAFSSTIAETKLEVVEFSVDRYEIIGSNPLSPRQTNSILSSHLGRSLSLEDLRQATADLEQAIRDLGYTFYRVVIPAQTLDGGVVKLEVLAFPVSKTDISGNQFHSKENVLRSLPELKDGESPRTSSLQRSLAIANLNSSKQTQVFFSVEPETGLEANISVQDQKTQNGIIWVDDSGTEDTGNYRIGMAYHNSNLFDRDHSMTASFSTSPDQVEDVQQYSLSYQVPFYGLAGVANVYAIRSDVNSGTIATFFDVAGRGDFIGGNFTYALPNAGIYKHFLVGGLDDKLFENDINFQGQPIGVDVRSRPLSLRHRGNWRRGALTGDTYAAYSINMESGSSNTDLAYSLTRAKATPDWSALRFGGQLYYALDGWAITGRLHAQYTGNVLIPGEQFGIGGLNSLRGINQRQLTGDRGLFLSGEIISPTIAENGPRLLAFVDGGRVNNVDPLPGEVESDTVTSIGGGVRWSSQQRINLSLDYGFVVEGSAEEGVANVDEGDSRLHLQLLWKL